MKKLILLTLLLTSICYATATFTASENSYYGRTSSAKKLTATITPTTASDANSSDRATAGIYGIADRITIATTGTDTVFGVIVKDENAITIFSKSDCNTVQTPLSYALYEDDTEGNPHKGIPVMGLLYFDANGIAYTSEQQTVQITSDANDPCSGTFELTYDDVNTTPLAYDINSAGLEAALDALSSINDVTVEGNDLPGDTNVMTVTFGGTHYGADLESMTTDVSNLAADTNDATITGTVTESVAGDYNLDTITVTIYYRDERY